ncbi:hypothetical protein [Metarhizobium album]|uniref:hypothetical protein n=1 Tax=Metarhizobium album TaxID=2182425 RepID=UPI001402A5C5|nr:hypothetical protein [Rhizobium album]
MVRRYQWLSLFRHLPFGGKTALVAAHTRHAPCQKQSASSHGTIPHRNPSADKAASSLVDFIASYMPHGEDKTPLPAPFYIASRLPIGIDGGGKMHSPYSGNPASAFKKDINLRCKSFK